jgi:tetratricopeptide (TPR) repeat protein
MKYTLPTVLCLLSCLNTPVLAQTPSLFEQGGSAFERQQYAEAASALEAHTRLNPKDLPALQLLARTYLALSRLALAEVVLKAALECDYNHPQTHELIGLLRFEQKDYLRARSEFRTLLYLKQPQATTFLNLLKTAAALQNTAEAVEAFRAGQQIATPDRRPSLLLEYLLFQLNRPEAERDPDYPVATLMAELEPLPLPAEQQKIFETVLFSHWASDNQFRKVTDKFFVRLEQAAGQQDVRQATALYADLLRWLGKSLNPDLDYTYMIQRMERLYQQYPNDVVTRQQLIAQYQRLDQPESLLALYRQELISRGATLGAREQAQLFRLIADQHLRMGYLQFAYDNYLRASDKDPQDLYSRLRTGVIYLAARDFREALKTFDKLLQQQPLLHEARLYRGFAQAWNKEPEKATQTLSALAADFEPELQALLRRLIADPEVLKPEKDWRQLLPELQATRTRS